MHITVLREVDLQAQVCNMVFSTKYTTNHLLFSCHTLTVWALKVVYFFIQIKLIDFVGHAYQKRKPIYLEVLISKFEYDGHRLK